MADRATFYPLGSSSAILQQQEYQLRQFTLAALSAREREKVRASPEPHLEIMRPVSPFQNKRPLAHQVAQDTQSQKQRDQRIWNPHYQTHSNSQPYTLARPSLGQETNQLSTSTNSHAARSGSRAKANAHRGDQRSARGAQRDTDISPALRMMNYGTDHTSTSSDHGQNSANTSGMLAPPDTGDMSRSTSPEVGAKRRNPGWRKPVPKYFPTPPSTPPTTTVEGLPSTRDRDEQVPPIPPPSSSNQSQNLQPNRLHPTPVRVQTAPVPGSQHQATPARPARAATDPQVPVMFRDFTSAKTRLGSIQQPAQAHTRQNGMSGLSRGTTTPSRSLARAGPSSRVENSNRTYAQVAMAPQAPAQAHTTLHDRAAPTATEVKPARPPSPEQAHDRTEAQAGVLVHPQPRKVPSMAQLVAMVMPTRSRSRSPSRTPSPGVHLTTADISAPIPLNLTTVEERPRARSPETLQATLPSVSVNPPTPIATVEVPKTTTLSATLLHPDQVQLPPSGSSSLKSSPSVSPQPSPRVVPAPLPTRPRSPTPAIIPQYAPPPPPFPSPPPNTPVAVPKPRMSSLLQPLLSSKLAEKAEATVVQVEACAQSDPSAQVPVEGRVVSRLAAKDSFSSEHSVPPTTRLPRKKQVPPGQVVVDSSKDQLPASRQTDESRSQAGRWSMMITERRSPSPIHKDTPTAPHVAGPADMNVTPANDRITELFSATSTHEHITSSRNLNSTVTRPNVKEAESIASAYANMSTPPRAQTAPPPREPEQARPPAREHVISSGKEQHTTARSMNDSKLKTSETATVAPVTNIQAPVRPRPVPVPMNEHAQVSRESGLVTPPDTPPGTVVSKQNNIVEEAWSRKHDHVAQSVDTDAKHPPRLQNSEPVSEVKSTASKALVRRKTLIQDEQPSWNDNRAGKESKNISRPASPIPSTDKPAISVVPLYAVQQEEVTPPLPNGWKSTITQAARSNTNPRPSSPVLTVEETDNKANVLPHMKPTGHAQNAQTTDMATASKYVIRGVSTEQVEHATMELEFHVHEVETRRVFESPQLTENFLVADKGNRLLSSRSPDLKTADLELPPTTPNVKQEHPRYFLPVSNTLASVPPEEPVRSRSPVPRRKAAQKYDTDVNFVQERTDESSIATTTAEETAVSSSTFVEPPVRRPVELSSRSHSSSSRRKVKATRTRGDLETRNAIPSRSEERVPDNEVRHRNPEVSVAKEVPSAPAEPESFPKLSSPPQRYQTLGGMKRLPFNGSEASLAQSRPKDSGREGLSSPQIAPRSLPPSTQGQPPARPPRHLHGQHKRLPAPEVTQAYRPPTPPIPSHYKKKNSNDLLPAEPPTFMKPAVHVIYPDTSTSHGHSFSGDSLLNFRPINNTNRGQTNPIINPQAHKEDPVRPQSPSLTIPTIDDDDDTVPDAYPQVPPKGRRHEANTNGSVTSDRLSDFAIQHATRGQVRYPSAPVGQARAHILMLPPNRDNVDGSFNATPRSRNGQQPRAKKAARSHSEKVLRKNDNVHPLARSRSTPIPSSRQRNRRGFWRIFGLWARVFMSKFRTWRTPTPSAASQSSEYGGYYDTY